MRMMKRLLMICLAIALLAGTASADKTQETPRIILYTCYTNLFPDGLELQAGCVDEDGGLWTLELRDADMSSYATVGEYLAAMLEAGKMTSAGKLDVDMFELNSLVLSAEDRGKELEAVCEGAGAESSWAVAWDVDDHAAEILLGVSGDSKFENTDPNAQALYLVLRETFPGVTNFAWSDMGPRGFEPVPVVEFCGWQDIDFDKVTIECYLDDCLVGPIPEILTDADRAEVIEIVTAGKVVGKANATLLTGGTTSYAFIDGEGNYLAELTLFTGLLVRNDGMSYLGE